MEDNKAFEDGVYYKKEDYAGLFRRSAIVLIDMTLLLIIFGIIGWGWNYLDQNFLVTAEATRPYLLTVAVLSYIYLSVLKPSRFRTIGYMLTKVKIVDLKGQKPSFLKMLMRFILLAVGPLEMVFDILWLTGEETRQTFRDKYVGTYVVHESAEPAGSGKQKVSRFNVAGWHLMFREVEKQGQ